MTEEKVGEIKEYDVYRDSLFRYLGESSLLSIKNLMMQLPFEPAQFIYNFNRIHKRAGRVFPAFD